jgi:hypothetical protein
VIVLTIYTLVFFLGMILSTVVYPHYVNSEKLVLRYMFYHMISVDITAIEGVTARKRECKANKTIETDTGVEGSLLALNVWRETEVVLRFKQPYRPIINGEPSEDSYKELAFSTDEPGKAVKAIQDML